MPVTIDRDSLHLVHLMQSNKTAFKPKTRGQSNLAKAALNVLLPSIQGVGGSRTRSNTMFHWPPRVFTLNRILICSAIFAQRSRVEPHDRQTLRSSMTIVCTSCIRCSPMIQVSADKTGRSQDLSTGTSQQWRSVHWARSGHGPTFGCDGQTYPTSILP